jgi:hypothetical protein
MVGLTLQVDLSYGSIRIGGEAVSRASSGLLKEKTDSLTAWNSDGSVRCRQAPRLCIWSRYGPVLLRKTCVNQVNIAYLRR